MMIALVSGATRTMDQYAEDPRFGCLYVPRQRVCHEYPGKPYALDNGAYSQTHDFNADKFLALLDEFRTDNEHCLWVASPDVVGDALQTTARYEMWAPIIRTFSLPVAYVLQDGVRPEDVPADCDAVFVGGTTEFKLGPTVPSLIAYAKARGKRTHMGRVNGEARLRYAHDIGCDSVDGTSLSRYPDVYFPRFATWIDRLTP